MNQFIPDNNSSKRNTYPVGLVHLANIAAGLMVEQSAKWVQRMPVETDLSLKLLATEWGGRRGYCGCGVAPTTGIQIPLPEVFYGMH
jgi:hypothetical protein